MKHSLRCGKYLFDAGRPLIMGIVNLTGDSFSGDGLADDHERAVAHARRLVDEGADILDLGAESTRPGAPPVALQDELERLLPVLERIAGWNVPVSVDTYKPAVMRAAIAAGAAMINDIAGLAHPDSLAAVAESTCGVCVMHMLGEPRTMQQDPRYGDVVGEVAGYLAGRVAALRDAGIAGERIVVDPGFCFGKTLEHNLALFRALPELAAAGAPVLVGVSRKSMLGAITGKPVGERLAASVAAACLAAERGAAILRVHDVEATKDALAVWSAIKQGENDV